MEEISKIKASQKHRWGTSISQTVELLPQIHNSFCRLHALNTKAPEKEYKIWMDRRMWQSLLNCKENTHEGPHTVPSRPKYTMDYWSRCQQIRKNRAKNDNTKITKDSTLKVGDRVLIMNYNSHGLNSKFFGDWKIWKFNSDSQVVVQNPVGDFRTLSTRHVKWVTHDDIIFSICDLFKPSWKQ